MVWKIALNVWLLLVGLTWWGQITATPKVLGISAIIVVIIFVLEMLWVGRRTNWTWRQTS